MDKKGQKYTTKNILRKIYYEFSYRNYSILTIGGSDLIAEMLRSDKPFLVSRLGSEESRTVLNWMKGLEIFR